MASLFARFARAPAGGLRTPKCQLLKSAIPPRKFLAPPSSRRCLSSSIKVAARHYTDHHEWVDVGPDGKTCTIGISKFVSSEMGDVLAATLPSVGDKARQGSFLAKIESVAMAGRFLFPVSGKVTAVNEMVEECPEIVNEDPEGSGWLAKVEAADVSLVNSLMTKDAYDDFIRYG